MGASRPQIGHSGGELSEEVESAVPNRVGEEPREDADPRGRPGLDASRRVACGRGVDDRLGDDDRVDRTRSIATDRLGVLEERVEVVVRPGSLDAVGLVWVSFPAHSVGKLRANRPRLDDDDVEPNSRTPFQRESDSASRANFELE